jgi:DNA-binding beta-propeller fold protein YncE
MFKSILIYFVLVIGFLGFSLSAIAETATSPMNFHELTRFQIGGDGGWDYVTMDSAARRLYIARSNRILILDADTGKILGEVGGLEGAHGVALVQDLGENGLGFATSGKSAEIVVFDLKTLKTVERIKGDVGPDAIVYDSSSKRILAFNGRGKSATIIDPVTRKVVGTIPMPGKPEFAVVDGSGNVFVNVEDKNELLRIDPVALKIVATYPLSPCEDPAALAMDHSSGRLIVGCGNELVAIVDAKTGKVIQTLKAGKGIDATAFDPQRKLAYASAGEGVLTVLAEDSSGFRVLQTVSTIKGARTLAVDAKTGRAFLPFAQFGPKASSSPGAPLRPTILPGTFGVLVIGG